MIIIQIIRNKKSDTRTTRIIMCTNEERPSCADTICTEISEIEKEIVVDNAALNVDVNIITDKGTFSTNHSFAEYPNVDIEFINAVKPAELITRPRTRIELQSEDNHTGLYTYIWAAPEQEDYTDKIKMLNYQEEGNG